MILLYGIKAVHVTCSFLWETSKWVQDEWNQTLLYYSQVQIWKDLHTVIELDSPSFIDLNI